MSVFTAVNVNEEDPELKEKIVVKKEYAKQGPLRVEGKLRYSFSRSIYLSFMYIPIYIY